MKQNIRYFGKMHLPVLKVSLSFGSGVTASNIDNMLSHHRLGLLEIFS